MGGGGPGKKKKTKDEEGKQSLNNGFLSYVYTTHCLFSSLFSPSYYTRTVFFRAEERTFVSAPRPAAHYLYVHPILHCVCCAVLCCAGAAIEKESFYISKQEEEKPFKPLLVSPAHIILMRPPLVPYNPVITLTWTFSFFWVLFSPSTPVILRLLTSFSFLFLNSGGTSRLLIHTRIHRDAGGDDPQAPRVDISTAAAAPFLVLPAVASLFL